MNKSVIDLLNDLEQRTRYVSKTIIGFKYCDEAQLYYRASPNSWSAFECISHLNQYYVFYLPLIRHALASNKKHKGYLVFKPGILGTFFISLLEPKNGGIRKIKAVSAMLPKRGTLNRSELKHFIMYQNELLSLLEACKDYDINSIFIRTVMSKWVTLTF